jgi:ABC-type antimicrobial peptide transport system permease subunit
MATPDIHNHFDAVRDELKNSGAVAEMAESVGPLTAVWRTYAQFDWKGKDPGLALDFPATSISYGYGKTVGWQFKEGRDFSKEFATDSAALVLNEAAVKFMGLKNAVGETIKWDGQPFKVIGVIKDMLVESPYEPVRPSLYCIAKNHDNFVIIKMNSAINVREALSKIETIFKKYSPVQPFDYQFVDEEYGKKFGNEERIGKLASFFAILAIFISCLGLFGMASFMAEQRTKEIGVRKVLGASVTNLWGMLSKDFVVLVVLSCFIAVPIGWYFMNKWLENFAYRIHISWQIFVASGMIALMIALLTVSFQTIKAALANPVKSLRTE